MISRISEGKSTLLAGFLRITGRGTQLLRYAWHALGLQLAVACRTILYLPRQHRATTSGCDLGKFRCCKLTVGEALSAQICHLVIAEPARLREAVWCHPDRGKGPGKAGNFSGRPRTKG